jgi:hypothetical protein
MASRFLNLLKTKTIGGSNQASATELNNSADSVFLEPANLQELLQIGHINKAIQASRQNGGIPKGSLSKIESITVSDSPTVILQPTNEEVYQINAITIKESAGSTATVTFVLTDGTTSMQLGASAGSANQETNVFGPFKTDLGSFPLTVTSKSYLMASRDNACDLLISYHVLQS